MPDYPGCVAYLADIAGVSFTIATEYDWDVIERSLGQLRLPSDYKASVEVFPKGKFSELISVIRPGDMNKSPSEYLGYYSTQLEDMRNWREKGHGEFPYPIFPEPEGLLPWGVGPRGELCFWLTNSTNPEDWPVVTADVDFVSWKIFEGTMCQFLVNLVSGRVGNPFGSKLIRATTAPAFTAFNESAPAKSAVLPPKTTSAPRWGSRSPENEFVELAHALGAENMQTRSSNWLAVELKTGLPLPDDYKAFIDMFGTGTFCDIRIVGPDPCDDFDMFNLMRLQHDRATASNRAGRLAFHPDPEGLVAWGETTDGWTCHWRLTAPDPNKWGVAMVSPRFQPVFHDELSFSSFLLKYSGHRDQQGVFFAREPWRGGVTFDRHLH